MRMLEVECGDMRQVLRGLTENSFDACVCDPPYELGFMGKSWDSTGIAFDPKAWAEVYRVLKPGAHIVAFGGTRTWHRIAVAIEDAGFQIRDSLAWLYGSGMPKSSNISKLIDKQRPDDVRHVCRFLRAAMDSCGVTSKKLAEHFRCHSRLVDHWAARDSDSQPSLPTWEQWLELKVVLQFADHMDEEVQRLNARKGTPGEAYQAAEIVGEHKGETGGLVGMRFSSTDNLIRAPNSELAKKWEGFGTALKPSFEPIILARKPLIGTIVENIKVYGTAGLNIDAARVPHASAADLEKHAAGVRAIKERGGSMEGSWKNSSDLSGANDVTDAGRWPPNVVCDEEIAADLDETNGVHPSAPYKGGPKQKRGQIFDLDEIAPGGYSDSGGVSRYFYCPKAAGRERDAGLTQWPPISGAEATNSEEGQARLKNGRTGAGRSSTGQDEEEWEIWVNEDRKAVLRVAMAASQPRVIDESTTSDRDATEWSTFLFGSDTTAPCLTASKCTIETKSSSTTASRILNYLAVLLTSESTAAALSRMESSTSPVANAELPNPCLDIIVGKTVSLPGVGAVASGTRLRISVGEKRKHARRCFHPTVKPLALMRWLCRLVTPPGGFILDPFAGSGTTGCAAALEGFHFAGIELDPVHTRLAMDRIMHWARSIHVDKV